MKYLPLLLDIRSRPCLLIGRHGNGATKLKWLQQAGAQVTHCATYDGVHQLQQQVLVVVAGGDEKMLRQVAHDAHARNIPINVVDRPDLSTVIFPAIVDRDPILIALSSAGTAPSLMSDLRGQIESLIPADYGDLAILLHEYRSSIQNIFPNTQARRHFMQQVLNSSVSEYMLGGNKKAARQQLETLLAHPDTSPIGEVYLVGAGPGHPDLLTLRALRLLQRADIIFYDRLAKPVLDWARRDAHKIHVGKKAGTQQVPQSQISQLLVHHAKNGERVVRLKGGDPLIFGRGGEEIETLATHHIPFQIVPGITAANACASYAGIPLTHRDYAQSVRFLTGHSTHGQVHLPWETLLREDETLVFYMPLSGLKIICQQLITHGRDPATPAALITHGTLPEQQTIIGTLSNLPTRVTTVSPPTLLIIGKVVHVHQSLHWR